MNEEVVGVAVEDVRVALLRSAQSCVHHGWNAVGAAHFCSGSEPCCLPGALTPSPPCPYPCVPCNPCPSQDAMNILQSNPSFFSEFTVVVATQSVSIGRHCSIQHRCCCPTVHIRWPALLYTYSTVGVAPQSISVGRRMPMPCLWHQQSIFCLHSDLMRVPIDVAGWTKSRSCSSRPCSGM